MRLRWKCWIVAMVMFSLLEFCSCSSRDRSFNSFLTGYSEVDSILKMHFPIKGKQIYQKSLRPVPDEFTVPEHLLSKGVNFRKTYSLLSDDINQLLASLRHSKYESFKHEQGCFLCLADTEFIYKNKCRSIEVPVSTFMAERLFLGIEGGFLSSDFDLYIIDSKNGKFIPDRFLIKQHCDNSISHGFSRGIALSEERGIAIYWVQYW